MNTVRMQKKTPGKNGIITDKTEGLSVVTLALVGLVCSCFVEIHDRPGMMSLFSFLDFQINNFPRCSA